MDRRTILAGVAALIAGLVIFPETPNAQQTGRVYRVGVLMNGGATIDGKPNPAFDGLRKGMAQLGYVEGTNIIYEAPFPEGRLERLPGFASELVAKGVDAISTFGGPSTNAARKATTTVPVAAALVADPLAIGVAKTLERPGRNITGATNNDPELARRQLDMLKALLPKLARVAILSDSDIPGADASGLAPIERAIVAAARSAGLSSQVPKVRGPNPDLENTFKAMATEDAQALVVLEVPATIAARKRIAEFALKQRLPTMFWGGASDSGCLVSYGTPFTTDFPRLPPIIDKISKGANPADTPLEVVSRRELAINPRTARELGIAIPSDLLETANHVIE
ncbi:ABC transporter substrate-binding protein [Noviherbaspirillum massiliense]|uniref:ABC transporter substrate-binding protein n=1 Tax=Noviherbaspirillum massiliense TaxID=1465823 RepID=UPI00031D39B9|nr:ABC transporter substrate-binding protein [Noviherbaspirillum massiliense]